LVGKQLVDPVGESYKQGIPFRNLTESIDTDMRSGGLVRVGLLLGLDANAPHRKIAMVTASTLGFPQFPGHIQ